MDNIAHALVGAALGRAVADRHVTGAGWIGAVAANAPDWTELFIGLPGTRADYLILHRGITHSLIGALIETIGLTLLVGGGWRAARWWLARRGRSVAVPAWRWVFLCIGVTVLSHLYMDWQGSYGWRPFLPWNTRWYYLDWIAIADVFFWLVPLIGLAWGAERHWIPLSGALAVGGTFTFFVARASEIVAGWVLVVYAFGCVVAVIGWIRYWFGPAQRQRAAVFALLLLAAYAGAHGLAAADRKREIRQIAERRFGAGAHWAALTIVGQPFRWEAIYSSSDSVAGEGWQLPTHLRAPPVAHALGTSDGLAMLQFARFLAAEVDSTSRTVFLMDARFARSGRESWGVLPVRMD